MSNNLNQFGKAPPQANGLEESVLGALLIQNDAIYEIIDILDHDSFYVPAHRKVYSAIKKMNQLGRQIDIMTVAEYLKSVGDLDSIGGEVFLSELTDRVGTSAHLEEHARIVHQKKIQRDLIGVSSEIGKRAFDPFIDVEDLIEFAELELYKITDISVKKDIQPASEAVTIFLNELEERAKQKIKVIGIPTGLVTLDRKIGGFEPSDLIIVAARPSMGKTALVLKLARNMSVDSGKTGVIFSLEMSTQKLINRLISGESRVDGFKIKEGRLDGSEWNAVEMASAIINDAPILFDDTPAISIFELKSKCRKLKRTKELAYIVVDYLQLMTAGSEFKTNREGEVSFISRNLKALAKELDIPVIALSQLNRAVESRAGDKRPQLSDLRESGAIEQDADIVIFVHRPEYYNFTVDMEGNSLIGVAELLVSKNRNGAIGTTTSKFIKELALFENFNEYAEVIKDIPVPDNNDDITPNTEFEDEEPPF